MLKFIGNGSAFNVEKGNNSAYYIKGKNMLLIDCGSNVFERILKSNILEGVEHIHVLVTHTHADHVGSLADLILYMYYVHGEKGVAKVTVHSHIKLELGAILRLNGVVKGEHFAHIVRTKNNGKVQDDYQYKLFDDLGYTIFKTEHVNEIFSTGFILRNNLSEYYYSGDASEIEDYEIELLDGGYYTKMYIDTSGLDYEGNVHLSLDKLSKLITDKESRSKVYCMHLDNAFDEEKALSLGFKVTKNIFEEGWIWF